MEQYNVTGMSCAACQTRVEKAVSAVDGVDSCAVSLLTNSMGVEGSARPEDIIAAVEAAGYGASRKASCKVQVHVRNTGPFKDDIKLTSSDPSVISFNENNKFVLHGEGNATVYWMYGDDVKYSKDIKVIK